MKALGAQVQWVAEEQRAHYHAGLVHGANHLTTLLAQALAVLREAGVADPAATLRPLLTATLDNTLRSGHHALTGPIARGDVDTVAAHLAVLREPHRRARTPSWPGRRWTWPRRTDGWTRTRRPGSTRCWTAEPGERDRTGEAPR